MTWNRRCLKASFWFRCMDISPPLLWQADSGSLGTLVRAAVLARTLLLWPVSYNQFSLVRSATQLSVRIGIRHERIVGNLILAAGKPSARANAMPSKVHGCRRGVSHAAIADENKSFLTLAAFISGDWCA
jgi:hypothetical protein